MAAVLGAATTAEAGLNWTGNKSSDIADTHNYTGSGDIYIRNDFLTGQKNAILKLTGNVGKISGEYKNFYFGLNPDDDTPWRLTGKNGSTIYTLDIASDGKAINIGTWSSASSWVRMYAVNVKATNLNIGDSTTKTGRLQLDNLDDNASAVLGPVTLTVGTITIKNGVLEVKNGATVSTEQDIAVGSTGTGRLVMNGGSFTLTDGRRVYVLGNGSGAKGIICLKDGTLVARKIRAGTSGIGEVVFDGGTLKFDPTDGNDAGITADRMSATVGAGGGTVNVNGKTPTIACGIASAVTDDPATPETEKDGGLRFTGGGTAKLAGSIGYDGPTKLDLGTQLSIGASQLADIKAHGGITVALTATVAKDSTTPVLTLTGGGSFTEADLACMAIDYSAFAENAVRAHLEASGATVNLVVDGGVHGRWIGGQGDDRFSVAANWDDGQVPAADETLDFRCVSSAATIDANTGVRYATALFANHNVSFSGDLHLAALTNDTHDVMPCIAAGGRIVIDGDLVMKPAEEVFMYAVYSNSGTLEVRGDIMVEGGSKGHPCYNCSSTAKFVAKGIKIDSAVTGDYFKLNAYKADAPAVNWILGADGLASDSSSYKYWIDTDKGAGASIQPADGNLDFNARIAVRKPLTLNTSDTNGVARTVTVHNAIYQDGAVTVSGSGNVHAAYGVTSGTNPFTVASSATLSVKPGTNLTTGQTTVQSGAKLEVSESGTVSLGGNLTLQEGATLKFNFTERDTAPVLDLTDKTVTVGGQELEVSLTGTRPAYGTDGKYALTSGGKFAGKTAAKSDDCAEWVRNVGVANGDIYAEIAKGLVVIVK